MNDISIEFKKYILTIASESYFNNLLLIIAVVLLLVIVKQYLILISKTKFKNLESNIIIKILEKIKIPLVFALLVYLLLRTLDLDEDLQKVLDLLANGMFVFQLILILQQIIKEIFRFLILKDREDESELNGLYLYSKKIIAIVIWFLGIILFLSNIGYDVTSLIASLGVGGIAVALAVQNILKDIFSGFTIIINKPFEVGDYIRLDENQSGTVEKIDLRNTIIRTVNREELIIPNDDILNSRIYNTRSRTKRRVQLDMNFKIDTSSQKLEEFKNQSLEYLRNNEGIHDTDFRVVFVNFTEYSLVYRIVFFTKTIEYNEYLEIKEDVNLKIKKIAENNNIGFTNVFNPALQNNNE